MKDAAPRPSRHRPSRPHPRRPLPPRLPDLLLRLAARGEDDFAVLGDFDEEFAELAARRGRTRARRWYWRQGLRSAPRLLADFVYWRTVMFKNYLKVALRNIRRQKVYAVINIAGWAVGMTVCILILLWVREELSFDRFHANAGRIHRLTLDAHFGAPQSAPVAPTPAPPALVEEFPEIVRASRLERPRREIVRYEDREYQQEGVATVDPSFFEIFSFPFIEGDPAAALTRPYTVVLTESTARKIFGREPAVGKFIQLSDGESYAVTGVLEDVPRTSHLDFSILQSFETLVARNRAATENWFAISTFAYVLLEKGADPAAVEAKLPDFIDRHMGPTLRSVGATMALKLQPLTRIHLHSNFTVDVAPQGDIGTVRLFAGIALLVLLVASINFINLSTARASTRAKEVGLRKTLGAARRRLVGQFLGESVLYSLLAMVLAVGLHFPCLRIFGQAVGRPLEDNVFQAPWMLPALFGLAVLVGLAAGGYPSLVLSRFHPARVLKGQWRAGGGVWFRRILVVAQFSISILLIIGTLVISRQIRYVKSKPLGFDKENVLVIPGLTRTLMGSLASLRGELMGIPGVREVGAASLAPGMGISRTAFFPEGFSSEEPQLMDVLSIDPHFLDSMGIPIAAGRNFSENLETDRAESVLINRAAARRFGWDDPIGKRFVVRPDPGSEAPATYLNVVGMVEDFHMISLRQKIEAQVLAYNPNALGMATIRLETGDVPRTLEAIRKVWKARDPKAAFDYRFLDETFDAQYRADERMKTIIMDFGVLAVIIGCLGLFGMASFTVERRTKEIGIRKALGASATGIVGLLSKESLVLVAVSNAVAWPVALILMNAWLRQFAYRPSLSIWVFAAAAGLSLLIAFLTISAQSVRAALGRPADALRYE